MIYLCQGKYNEAYYDCEGFRKDEDGIIEFIRLVQADTGEEAVKKLAGKLGIQIWYDLKYCGNEYGNKVNDISITEMII